MNKIFKCSTLEKCLQTASAELGIPQNELKYKILREKKGFLIRYAEISVEIDEHKKIDPKINIDILEDDTTRNRSKKSFHKVNHEDGSISIKNGKIIVKDPAGEGNPAEIIPSNNISVYVDGIEIVERTPVFEKNKIEVKFEENDALRNLYINITEDGIEAYINIEAVPKIVYKLRDVNESSYVIFQMEKGEKIYPPLYTRSEIKEQLDRFNIKYGIIEENLEKCVKEHNIDNIIIAKGKNAIDDEDDTLEMKFESENSKKLKEDEDGNVDFKSIGFVKPVLKNDIVAIKHIGKLGTDGIDVKGKIIRHKKGKKKLLVAGEGCRLLDENTVVADIDGKPSARGNVLYVNKVHEVSGDVDLKTGNIQFIGDVIIYGSVKEGMNVSSHNNIDIHKNVEMGNVKAMGEIKIKGTVVGSTIEAGVEDVTSNQYVKDLKELKNILQVLVSSSIAVKQYNDNKGICSDGEIIKLLIEKKFKNIHSLCLKVINDSKEIDAQDNDIAIQIKDKLMGFGPLNIKDIRELEDLQEIINNKVYEIETNISLPVNTMISYCQDSNISSSGNIYVTGKGEYISNLTSYRSIYFTGSRSIARGGTIKASHEIKCKEVGSLGGVPTKLIVEKRGKIYVEVAYQNTIFVIGDREYHLEIPSKNVYAYLDTDGEIVVEKLKL